MMWADMPPKKAIKSMLKCTVIIIITVVFVAGCGESNDPAQGQAQNPSQNVTQDSEPVVQVSADGELPPCCAAKEQDESEQVAASQQAKDASRDASKDASTLEAPAVETTDETLAAAQAVVAANEQAAQGAQSTWRSSPWLAQGERADHYDLDWDVTDHEGRTINLQGLKGKPIAASFIYTRCPDPMMCPLIGKRFADLERRLTEAGLADQVQLWLISFDPAYDKANELTIFAKNNGIRFTSVRMIRPEPADMESLKFEFGVDAQRQSDGSIAHYTDLFIIDGQGRFVRYYTGGGWDNAKVMIDLARLAGENTSVPQGG